MKCVSVARTVHSETVPSKKIPSDETKGAYRPKSAHWTKLTAWSGWPTLVHAMRTAAAAVVSILVARLARLPETYWAAVTTLVVMQSSLGAALQVSADRLIGTALGALLAAIVASYFAPRLAVYGIGIFLLGLVCAITRSSRAAYRLGGVAFTIVLLISHTEPPWHVAFHRFAEVSIGIAVALVLTVVWPEKEIAAP
jgi:uncharacterized membrane protein YccC